MDPYIGITDFMNVEQVQNMLDIFLKNRPTGSKRKLHVGVMMSYKTLKGIETKWSKAFPAKEDIFKIFASESEEVYNCIHYADYEKEKSEPLWESLTEALSYCAGAQAIQLDMPWPEPAEVANGVHASRRSVEVILQIGKNAFDQANNNPMAIVEKLEEYDGIIHRVLLDKSMGRGLGMDAVGLIPFAQAVKEKFPNLGLVVAGGLGPDSMGLVEPLVKEFPDLSIDAQGKLRPSGNALDPIDWSMAGQYLINALSLLG